MASSNSSDAKFAMTPASAACCFRLAAIIIAGLAFSFLIDVADFGFTFTTFLAISGMSRGVAAAIAADEFWGRTLNRWDEAGFLIFLAMLIYWLSYPASPGL